MSSIPSKRQANGGKKRVQWYRCPIEPARLRELTKRSDLKGAFYAIGHLLLFAGTAFVAHYFFVRQIWIGFAAALWVHGTIRGVGGSGGHELAHGTVFRTKSLNAIFLRIWGTLGWDTPLPKPSHEHAARDPIGAAIGDIRPGGFVERPPSL